MKQEIKAAQQEEGKAYAEVWHGEASCHIPEAQAAGCN